MNSRKIKFHIHLPDLAKPLIDVLNKRGSSFTNILEEKATIRQVLEILSQGARRVLVGDGTPAKSKILSQADLVLFFLDRFDALPETVKGSLDSLGFIHPGRISDKVIKFLRCCFLQKADCHNFKEICGRRFPKNL